MRVIVVLGVMLGRGRGKFCPRIFTDAHGLRSKVYEFL